MEGRKRTTSDFSDYATVRSWLREIDCPLNSLERALYRLSQKVPSVRGRSWPDYASAVVNVLKDATSGWGVDITSGPLPKTAALQQTDCECSGAETKPENGLNSGFATKIDSPPRHARVLSK